MIYTNFREIDKEGRIVISKDIRNHLNIKPGDILHNEADAEKTSDPLISLEIWTLRASIARKRGRYDHAEFFLRQAFACGASVEAHSELAGVMLNTGRAEESRQLISLIRGFHTL